MKSRLLFYGIALGIASVAHAGYQPVTLSPGSYNADAVVESNATPVLKAVTTASVDNGTNNTASTWNEKGYDTAFPTNGLPPAGTVVVARDNANYSFKMPPTYVGNNGILIDTVITNGTFTLTTPAAYNLLSFAGSGGNGGDVIGVKVNHADGTFETGSFGCPDWFGSTGVILATGGRMGDNVAHTLQQNGDNPRIYFRDVTLTNTTSPVTSIVLSYLSGGSGSHNDILGVSGATTPGGPVAPIDVTGYTYDFVVEASADKRGLVVSQNIVDGTNAPATTQTMDNDSNTGYTFYEKGHNYNTINNLPFTYGVPWIDAIAQASGIPVAGSTFTNGVHVFKMAPNYAANNVVWMNPTITNVTITPVTPTAGYAISFLDAAGNGPVTPTVIIHYQDGSSQTNVITIQDWFSSVTPVYIPNGRVDTGSGQWSQQTVNQNGANRLFSSDMLLANTTSPVTSIDLVYTDVGGRAGIFAVSISDTPVPPIFSQQPVSTNTYAGSDFAFSAQVSSQVTPTFQWQKGTNGVFVNLSNGGNVSGATTATLSITAGNYFTDGADYRLIASNSGGSSTSSVATATLYSLDPDITQPGDPISAFNASLFGDGPPANAIDNSLGTKFGANLVNVGKPIGLVVSPNVGATVVTALRLYTANDSTGRDPADYKLEGSIDGGSSYTLIASNSVTLPDGRNSAGSPDPLSAFVQEVHFPNANGYTTYRLTFSHLKGGANQGSCQLGEFELLGVTTNLPLVVVTPANAKAYEQSPLSINATVTGSPTPDSRWQKQIGGVYTDLSDSGTVSGSKTAFLSINPASLSDSGLYRLIVTNTLSSQTSAPVQVTIFSTNVDVTMPGDPITDFGNTSQNPANPTAAIDDTFVSFISQGSGLNNNGGGQGFPPFGGPVGLVVTPAAGSTIVTGIRIYTSDSPAIDDPADVKLEGSNNGGSTYTTILPTTALSLPDDRNDQAFAVEPIGGIVQEILFPNSSGYTSYRVTFAHTKDDNAANILSIGEMELLGVAGTSVPQPVISGTTLSGGNLNFNVTGGAPNGTYSVLTNANVAAPLSTWGTNVSGTLDGSGNAAISLPVSGSNPRLFYLIKTP